MSNTYNVSVTWNGVQAPSPSMAVMRLQELLATRFPEGTVIDVVNDETGEETEVEL